MYIYVAFTFKKIVLESYEDLTYVMLCYVEMMSLMMIFTYSHLF
jgi:hypothetical protein